MRRHRGTVDRKTRAHMCGREKELSIKPRPLSRCDRDGDRPHRDSDNKPPRARVNKEPHGAGAYHRPIQESEIQKGCAPQKQRIALAHALYFFGGKKSAFTDIFHRLFWVSGPSKPLLGGLQRGRDLGD